MKLLDTNHPVPRAAFENDAHGRTSFLSDIADQASLDDPVASADLGPGVGDVLAVRHGEGPLTATSGHAARCSAWAYRRETIQPLPFGGGIRILFGNAPPSRDR